MVITQQSESAFKGAAAFVDEIMLIHQRAN